MFKTFSVKEMLEENKKLLEENARLTKDKIWLENWNNDLVKASQNLLDENRFLKQRNKELRQKSWFEVFEENLKLAEEIKQYQAVLESIEKFVGRFSNEKR
jgi:hypothetical protein